MSTLLLRLAGPMQSWGTRSRFEVRDTGLEPSKSGVVGLVCAALGWERDRDVTALGQLRMGVRVDRPGTMRAEFQTAGGGRFGGRTYGVPAAHGGAAGRRTVTSTRYYLADAEFLVGLEGEDEGLLRAADAALAAPRWQVCLGRKAFVPSVPVRLPDAPPFGPGLRAEGLEEALRAIPWGMREGDRWEGPPEQLRVVLEADRAGGEEVRLDQPIGAAFAGRRFAPRVVRTVFWRLGADVRVLAPAEAGRGEG